MTAPTGAGEQTISATEIDGRTRALQQQRDAALNQVVQMAGRMAAMAAQIDALKAENNELRQDRADK